MACVYFNLVKDFEPHSKWKCMRTGAEGEPELVSEFNIEYGARGFRFNFFWLSMQAFCL
jgi:hypothetical protein